MPRATLKLIGGVIETETEALNEAGISDCQLIRFKPDPKGISLPEKLGGWLRFWVNPVTNGPVRALWGYQDTQSDKWLVYGTENAVGAQLAAIECFTNLSTGITTAGSAGNFFHDITPQVQSDSVLAAFSTTAGSPLVNVVDPTVSGVTQYDVVYITTPVSVGGIVLSGMYALTTLSGDTYQLTATDVLGNALPAVYSTIASPITITSGTFLAGVTTGTITLGWATPNYTVPVGEAVVVNEIDPPEWNGTFICTASTTTSVTLAVYVNSLAAYVSGGTISNGGVVPQFFTTSNTAIITCILPDHGFQVGSTFYVLNETLINGVTLFGGYTVASVPNAYTFTFNGSNIAAGAGYQFQNAVPITNGTGDGTTVTITFAEPTYVGPTIIPTGGTASGTQIVFTWTEPAYTFVVGSTLIAEGFDPVDWNGTYVVQASTSTSVTVNSPAVDPFVSAGELSNAPFEIGAFINVSGIDSPSQWNGYQTITAVADTTVSYLNSTAGTWTTGGSISDNGGDVGFVYSIGTGPNLASTGYGVGGYGVGGYGTGQVTLPLTGAPIPAINWDITNWGDLTIACCFGNEPIVYASGNAVTFQPIYYWDPTANQQKAQAISSGPPVSNGVFVAMPQRQIVAWGSSFSGDIDPLQIRWCDINNYTSWVAQTTNQAGSFRLASGSKIVGALQTAQQGLIWTDIELWSMQYTGFPYVYGFNKIGVGCGLIARHAVCSLNGVPFWMSNTQFFMLTSGGVTPIQCPVWDVAFQDIDLSKVERATATANSLFQEITWYFPVQGGTGDNSKYVRYNVVLDKWDFGTLSRTAWIDVSALGQPIGADPVSGYLYQHEISPDADGMAMDSWFETGFFVVQDGDYKVFIDQVWPNFKYETYGSLIGTSAQIELTFTLKSYPDGAATVYGPYTVNSGIDYISPRMRGRLMKMKVESDDLGSWWRIGALRYRWAPDGKFG